MKRTSNELEKSGKQEMVSFREYSGIMRALKNYADANDLTISQVVRKAIRRLLLQSKSDARLLMP